MAFEIDEVIGDMAQAIKGSVKEDWPDTKEAVKQFLERRKERMKLIAELVIKGVLTIETAKPYLDIEKDLLEMEILGVTIITKAMAQKAATKAMKVLVDAVKAAIPLWGDVLAPVADKLHPAFFVSVPLKQTNRSS